MVESLKETFLQKQVETPDGNQLPLHSHTSESQGYFLQEMFDLIKPKSTLEVGMAYGISSLFILEKHREYKNPEKSHLIIEPYSWQGVAEHYFEKEKLSYLTDIRYKKSDEVLPKLYYESHRIQYAYIDTTKLFDVVMQDVYFIDKILDVNGVLILDDCGGYWPGIQKVARFLNSLPHYKFLKGHKKYTHRVRRELGENLTSLFLNMVPFRKKFISELNLKTNHHLGLEYRCIAFQKISEDKRNWDWDRPL
ncbi:MAG: class I SAM-dependent methyltransferase [Chitinophagaceae bacterium]|nr:class I SAM-dependent methyltransferase [Chitinophagaceae bacterium]